MTSNTTQPTIIPSTRIDWIDYAKGLAIILTILGHTVGAGFLGSTVRGLIFSFHMPLFFILSITTFNCSTDMNHYMANIKKAVKHLLIPALVTFGVLILADCIGNPSHITSGKFWNGKLMTLVFASGVDVTFNNGRVGAIGIPWFFFALFLGRAIFDFLNLTLQDDKKLLIASIIAGMFGILWGAREWMPFSLDIALAIMPFFYFGKMLKNLDLKKHLPALLLSSLVIWLFTLYLAFPDFKRWTYLELAVRRYTLFPISYITAIAGTVFVAEISILACRVPLLAKPILYIGKNSLYVLCVHILDNLFQPLWYIDKQEFASGGLRIVTDLVIFAVFMILRAIATRIHSVFKKW